MDPLQKQVKELENKIGSLYKLVEKIGERVVNISDGDRQDANAYFLSFEQYQGRSNSEEKEIAYSLSHHKDILLDETISNSRSASSNERELSPDIQIRRLTAQLTAAYNRIAALEEQLLSHRIKS
jgi:hypothetical protein